MVYTSAASLFWDENCDDHSVGGKGRVQEQSPEHLKVGDDRLGSYHLSEDRVKCHLPQRNGPLQHFLVVVERAVEQL